jgi:hypothetical protein
VLLYCRDTVSYLHRHQKVSQDYAGYLHLRWGFVPPGDHLRDYDHRSLVRTAQRETKEKCGIGFDLPRLPNLLLGEELKIGFVFLTVLGVCISKDMLDNAMSNPEGRIVRVKAAELPGRLHDHDWVPAGKIQVLAWLALGAPIGRRRVRFGKASGQIVSMSSLK